MLCNKFFSILDVYLDSGVRESTGLLREILLTYLYHSLREKPGQGRGRKGVRGRRQVMCEHEYVKSDRGHFEKRKTLCSVKHTVTQVCVTIPDRNFSAHGMQQCFSKWYVSEIVFVLLHRSHRDGSLSRSYVLQFPSNLLHHLHQPPTPAHENSIL